MPKLNSEFGMKKTFLFVFALFNAISFAQDSETTAQNQKDTLKTRTAELIYKTPKTDVNPAYPGGIQELYKFIKANYKTPKTSSDVSIRGNIYIGFIVEKDGSLTDFKILRDIGYGSGQEAIRVLKLSQKWIGKNGEEIAASPYILPITIR